MYLISSIHILPIVGVVGRYMYLYLDIMPATCFITTAISTSKVKVPLMISKETPNQNLRYQVIQFKYLIMELSLGKESEKWSDYYTAAWCFHSYNSLQIQGASSI